MEELKKELREYIVENFLFGDEETKFEDEESFMEKGILDSTGILDVILFIEENYGIKVEDDELVPENLDSINNLSKFISKKQNSNN